MTSAKHQSVIIVAGGAGNRIGGELPKQFLSIGGKPMLMHAIQAFYNYDERVEIIVVLPQGYSSLWKQLCSSHRFKIKHSVGIGGKTRFHSVKNGLKLIRKEDSTVAVHDAARPFVTTELIGRCYSESIVSHCGVIPVVDEVNSLRQIIEGGSQIVDRRKLKIVQTPQLFPVSILREAYQTDYDSSFTDDASVAENIGIKIRLVAGEETNIKITTPFDLIVAESYFQQLKR